ncbi:cysteine methyltransferase [Kitasatospora sp. MMS16-BH015]|uniref:methylated-DNA--[protein]-cysteine S-methyltransferase n=1 Tax=Kitasatospora sp. MMS16-BH015 TaxID=2018025 RepID=UPI000CA293FD|nr:methylated-DNA--[protein]-cysteine S-methyltransferase [Kitasatospora sp. MMS16-BH015]AUG78029.1 cysteine methyltransferase [Kitasatospora sp. MMS16-BH015]
MAISWLRVETPLPSGAVWFGVTAVGVAAASFEVEPGRVVEGPECTDEWRAGVVRQRVAEYFAGRSRGLELPIDWRSASGPHRTVLQTLHAEVPYGETVTYGRLAALSGAFEDLNDTGGQAARAVGQMMHANPLALLVPCHRVVAADGLGGFFGGPLGLETKRWLLTLEGVLPPTLDWTGPA